MSRIVDITQGRIMVVTDLHGDWLAYWRYIKRFLELRAEGRADYLLLCGDLIHSYNPEAGDYSLEIVLDVLNLREELGDRLIVLLGNHEVPHLYGFPLRKGGVSFTPPFERALGEYRAKVLAFFDALPLFVRTAAGVALAHAGASRAGSSPTGFRALVHYSHAREINEVEKRLQGQDRAALRAAVVAEEHQSYDQMAVAELAISGPSDPRYDHLLRGLLMAHCSENFPHLWDALFNRNEEEYGQREYRLALVGFLDNLSDGFAPQRYLVSGHIPVRGGSQVVAEKQLRLASWAHAQPPEAGQYLLFDAGQPIESLEALRAGLASVWT
ncbi:MAG: metallophosphoesterase [Anaerolineales bacterium]|nr:metallophosphoesterase [Anaerolineales bacterium]